VTITKERIRELAEQAGKAKNGYSSNPFDYLEAAIRLGMAEMREVAAQEIESHTIHESEVVSYTRTIRFIRAIRIEGEEND
jgi:hypothetical protein